MMDILLIIDSDFSVNQLKKIIKNSPAVISLYSLTSNFLQLEKCTKSLRQLPNVQVNLLDNAKAINQSVSQLRQNILEWSSQLGEFEIGNKKIKEWFVYPDQSGSAWWLGMISEMNCVQDNVFLKIAQVNAIHHDMQQQQYDKIIIGLTDNVLKKIICKIAKKFTPNIYTVSVTRMQKSLKSQLFHWVKQTGILGGLCSGLIYWFVWLRDSLKAKKNLPTLSSRIKQNNPLLFVSYFPNIDEESAKQGIFRNKYAVALQKEFAAQNIPITWLLMPVFYNNHNFDSSLNLANRFIKNNESIFLLQEFFNFKFLVKGCWWWLKQSLLCLSLFWRIKKITFTDKLTIAEALPLIKYLWMHSFLGESSVRGIIFYLSYQNVFRNIPNIKNCLYYCEMQAWEKALLLAKNKVSPQTKTFAFQHTTVIKNHFNYFYAAKDLVANNKVYDMPLPNLLLANGEKTYELLAENNYPNLCEVEAIRQLYLNRIMTTEKSDLVEPVLFIAGSFDRHEMRSLIAMIYLSYPVAKNFAIWFKGSPANPLEPIFAELEINVKQANYKILHQDISEILPKVTITVAANTTVSVEAAGSGCPVIIPIFADVMLMNPIVDTNAPYYLVGNVAEFKQTVESLIKQTTKADNNLFIKKYWHLDVELPRWKNIIAENFYV